MTLCGTLNYDQAPHNAFIGRVLGVLERHAPEWQALNPRGTHSPSD
jgi:hypothetical protein